MKLYVEKSVHTDPRFPLSRPELHAIFTQLAISFGLEECSVALRVVDDQAMADAHMHFMGCLGPTNILSFPADTGEHLGDMLLSSDTLYREAFLYNQDTFAYTVRLLAHGLLHLMGYNHGQEMDVLTDQAVDTLGFMRADDGLCLFATL